MITLKLKTLRRSAIESFTAKFISLILGFLLSVLLARLLGAENYGLYALSFAVLSLIIMPIQKGLQKLTVRELSNNIVINDIRASQSLLVWGLIITVIYSFVAIVTIKLSQKTLGQEFYQENLDIILIGAYVIPAIGLLVIVSSALRALKKVFWGSFGPEILRPVLFIFLVITYTAFKPGLTAQNVMIAYLIASILTSITMLVLLYFLIPREYFSKGSLKFKPKTWLQAILPLTLTAGLYAVLHQTDVIMIGAFKTSREVAQYHISVRVGAIASFGLTALNVVLQPYVAQLHIKGDLKSLQKVVSYTTLLSSLGAVLLLVIYVLLGKVALKAIFGDEFLAAYVPLIIITLGHVANAIMGPVGLILNMTSNEVTVFRVVLLACIFNVLMNLIFIPLLGATGAALASFLTLILQNLILWRRAYGATAVDASIFSLINYAQRK
ncbi:oligosaccharide flippase family protein [Planktomarina temperata]|nr:oligosaccharide flippase family protein [Planktomarina temperata]